LKWLMSSVLTGSVSILAGTLNNVKIKTSTIRNGTHRNYKTLY